MQCYHDTPSTIKNSDNCHRMFIVHVTIVCMGQGSLIPKNRDWE